AGMRGSVAAGWLFYGVQGLTHAAVNGVSLRCSLRVEYIYSKDQHIDILIPDFFIITRDTSMLDSRMERLEGKLAPAERTLLAYIQANQETLAFETGATLAAKSGVSPNTVSRFLRRLGYKGLKSLKEELRDDVRMQSLLNTT